MRSKIILAIMVALLSGETLAADPLPSVRFSELSWIPASPHQLQVLGLTLEALGRCLTEGGNRSPSFLSLSYPFVTARGPFVLYRLLFHGNVQ
jgi:hypothetical protein